MSGGLACFLGALAALVGIVSIAFLVAWRRPSRAAAPPKKPAQVPAAPKKPAQGLKDAELMRDWQRRVLVAYLLLVGSLLVLVLAALIAVDFPESGLPAEEPQVAANLVAPGPPSQPGAPPQLIQVFPQSTLGSTPSVYLAVYGRNFDNRSKIRFNAHPRATESVGPDLIKATPLPSDLVDRGSITVDVVNGEGRISNAIAVPIQRPRVPLALSPWWQPRITRELQLILLAIFAGALGSYIHALKSFADFVGNRSLTASWFWWYLARPFLGMAMALVFYAVIRGGFVAGTPADAKIVNPFGVIAVGALVGMFADRATQKLSEIFDTLFRTDDPRTGKLDAPIIYRLDPELLPAGITPPPVLTISGDRLGKVTAVRLNGEERKPDKVSENVVSLKLLEKDVAEAREIEVSAVNSDGSVTSAGTLRVTAVAITSPKDDALQDGTVGADYAQDFDAEGGSSPYEWSVDQLPAGLQMDKDAGRLAGKPTAAGTSHVAVTVKDKNGKTSTKAFDLAIKGAPPPAPPPAPAPAPAPPGGNAGGGAGGGAAGGAAEGADQPAPGDAGGAAGGADQAAPGGAGAAGGGPAGGDAGDGGDEAAAGGTDGEKSGK
jgi:hypothetical protein